MLMGGGHDKSLKFKYILTYWHNSILFADLWSVEISPCTHHPLFDNWHIMRNCQFWTFFWHFDINLTSYLITSAHYRAIFNCRQPKRMTYQKVYSSWGSTTSTISSSVMAITINKLKLLNNRDSNRKNYYGIWKKFNQFYMHLDCKPTIGKID